MIIEGITFTFVFWCMLFGLFGQALRVIIGLYKLHMNPEVVIKEAFNWKRLIISLIMGGAVGLLCVFIFADPLTKTDAMSILAFGYAGVDGVEGFMNRRASSIQ
jgi:hypothetical protein